MSETTDQPAPRPMKAFVLSFVGGLAIGLSVGAAATLKVWWDASAHLEQTEALHAEAIDDLEAQLEASRAETAEALAKVEELTAETFGLRTRIGVARAIEQIDQRNFGLAQDEVQQARTLLAKAPSDVQEAARTLRSLDIRVSENPGAQREVLRRIANDIDAATAP